MLPVPCHRKLYGGPPGLLLHRRAGHFEQAVVGKALDWREVAVRNPRRSLEAANVVINVAQAEIDNGAPEGRDVAR